MPKELTRKERLKLETQKMREIVLRIMRETANGGGSIGLADPATILGLADNLEKNPSQWFAAGLQLMNEGLISREHWEILQGIQRKPFKS